MRKNMFSSLLLFVSVVVILLTGFGGDVYCQDALYFNVKVVKELQPNEPQRGAEVVWYQNGVPRGREFTNEEGIAYNSLTIGTYDVYVYYPPRPNNVSTGKLLNHYHDRDETVTIMLGPQY